MRTESATILLVCADADVTHQLLHELPRRGYDLPGPVAGSLRQARARLRKETPHVVLVDESAVSKRSWAAAVRGLVSRAYVICLASVRRQAETAGLNDLVLQQRAAVVWRDGRFLPRLVLALENQPAGNGRGPGSAPATLPSVRPGGLGTSAAGADDLESQVDFRGIPEDFGEILRHEVNNPLTGILGNAELLLARREALPAAAVQRLQTIAALAVRLRETIRRLSNAWDSHDHQVRSA